MKYVSLVGVIAALALSSTAAASYGPGDHHLYCTDNGTTKTFVGSKAAFDALLRHFPEAAAGACPAVQEPAPPAVTPPSVTPTSIAAASASASGPFHPEVCNSTFGVSTLPETDLWVQDAAPLIGHGYRIAVLVPRFAINWNHTSDGVYAFVCNPPASMKATGVWRDADGNVQPHDLFVQDHHTELGIYPVYA